MNKGKTTTSLFNKGFNCSQAMLSAYASELNLNRETAIKIASGFGGEIGRTGEICGAVTGAVIIIGLKYAAVDARDRTSKAKTYEFVEEFIKKFKSRNDPGSILCRELLGVDISLPDSGKTAKEKCPKYIMDAIEIINEIA